MEKTLAVILRMVGVGKLMAIAIVHIVMITDYQVFYFFFGINSLRSLLQGVVKSQRKEKEKPYAKPLESRLKIILRPKVPQKPTLFLEAANGWSKKC